MSVLLLALLLELNVEFLGYLNCILPKCDEGTVESD